MQDVAGRLISVRVPDELGDAIQILQSATGRDDYDVVTSALRTYLADQRQRDTVNAFFRGTPHEYPSAYVVTARATLHAGLPSDADSRRRAEEVFGHINRYAPTRLEWSTDAPVIRIEMAVSGHNPDQAGVTAAKMVRNRIVEELQLSAYEDLTVEIVSIDPVRHD